MNDATTQTAVAASTVVTFKVPGTETEVSIDAANIPADARLELLKKAIASTVVNRVNVANVRHAKLVAPFTDHAAAVAAHAADPITNPAPGAAPEGVAPTHDPVAKANEAIASLLAGKLGATKGEGKPKVTRDPVDKAVTDIVVREVFNKNKALDNKYTWPLAVKEVGASGTAYLKARIEALVASGQDGAALEKMLETRYLAPARTLCGVDVSKKQGELPAIL